MSTVSKLPLAGQQILVTRPQHQCQALAELVEAAGGKPLILPVIDIEAVAKKHWQTINIDHFDWVIFVSRNAVESFIAGWGHELPKLCQFAAVGEGTAQAMREHDIPVDCQPEISNGSEGLLQMPLMQASQVRGKQVLIVRGNGGREHMADTLTARGANITYIEVYQRVLAQPTAAKLKQAMMADKVICTSVAGVDNLCSIFMNTWPDLLDKPLTVVSDRIKQHASSRGFKTIYVSADASDNAVVDTLINMDD